MRREGAAFLGLVPVHNAPHKGGDQAGSGIRACSSLATVWSYYIIVTIARLLQLDKARCTAAISQ